MKHKIALTLASGILVLSMAGCQPGEPGVTTSPETTAPQAAVTTAPMTTAGSPETTAPEIIPDTTGEATQPLETEPGKTDTTTPKPTESKPTEPKATDPKPTSPKPTESKPTNPKPTDPPAHTHSYKAKVVSPTCTERGYTLHTCTCGTSYKDNETAALGHNLKETVVAPTTTDRGYTLHSCTRCDYSYKDSYTDPIPPETTAAPKEYIDLRALEEYGRQYARDTYGYDGNPNTGFNTNAGYGPPQRLRIRSMEEGYKRMREAVDGQYEADTALGLTPVVMVDGKEYHLKLNVYIEPDDTDPNGVRYLIYVFYGGE